jgi:hypothetical protein
MHPLVDSYLNDHAQQERREWENEHVHSKTQIRPINATIVLRVRIQVVVE